MSDFKIERDVPIPYGGINGRQKYPWREMEIGDSILVPPRDGESLTQLRARLGNSIALARPFRFVTRREAGGIRVWRVEPAEL